MGKLITGTIRAYQYLVSPLLPPACRFHPSCSDYALDAVHRYGAFLGTALAVWRLLKCHPLHPGGLDPVPERLRRPRWRGRLPLRTAR